MKTMREIAIEGLKNNKRIYGQPYCPCIPPYLYDSEDSKDYICPCKKYRTEKICCCGLYESKGEI